MVKHAMMTDVTRTKDKTFGVRLSPEDIERLRAVAAHYSVPAGTLLRMLVKREFDKLPPETAPKKTKK